MSGPALPESPVRNVSDDTPDDTVLPFSVPALDVRGRIVRLGPAIDRILRRHAYPAAVAGLVAEAAALTVLLGSSLKFSGRFQLQTRTDGLVDMLVVDFDAPDRLRAFARFDTEQFGEGQPAVKLTGAELLGKGHLAFTIDQGANMAHYQGIVPLEGQGLEAAALHYFQQSEQIPTLVRLAFAQNVTGEGQAWRAGGLIVQFLPRSPERARQPDIHPGDAPEGAGDNEPSDISEDDAWLEAKALAATVADHELVDPTLSGERLLYRLFHERGVSVFDTQPVHDTCRCTQQRIETMLRQFSPQERHDMIGPDGKIGVTCEFCSEKRVFEPAYFDPAN